MVDTRIGAMAFYHEKGLVPAFGQARRFAGASGRIGTLLDVVDARMAGGLQAPAWNNYFTTLSAEFAGLSRGGNPIAIVAHGVGPLSTLEGILAAYKHEYGDETRNRRGGRIPQADFLKLESGAFGDIAVVDLAATWARRPYQFSGHPVTIWEITDEPLWRARLGKRWEAFCERLVAMAQVWAEVEKKARYRDPCILAMENASNCSYSDRSMFDHWMAGSPDTAIAHLLSIGRLGVNNHQYWRQNYMLIANRTSLGCDVSCHEWSNGVRMIGIRDSSTSVSAIHPGLDDIFRTRDRNWRRLLRPNPAARPMPSSGFFSVRPVDDDTWFTTILHKGKCMASSEPEFRVVSIEPVDEEKVFPFRTEIEGYYGLFRYDVCDVRRIAPLGANAYQFVGEGEIEWENGNPTHHWWLIQFYRVEVDNSQRLLTTDQLRADFDLSMSLLENDGG